MLQGLASEPLETEIDKLGSSEASFAASLQSGGKNPHFERSRARTFFKRTVNGTFVKFSDEDELARWLKTHSESFIELAWRYAQSSAAEIGKNPQFILKDFLDGSRAWPEELATQKKRDLPPAPPQATSGRGTLFYGGDE